MKTSESSRKGIVTAIGIFLAVGIAAGAQAQGTPPPQSTGTEGPSILLLGVMRLQGTPAAVSPQQATQWLSIVQAWRQQLSQPPASLQPPASTPPQSPPPPQQPAGGGATVVHAIQAIPTPQQQTAISGMNLTSADVTSWLASPSPAGSVPGAGGPPQGQPGSTPPSAPSGTPPPSGSTPQENPTLRFADAVITLLALWATGP